MSSPKILEAFRLGPTWKTFDPFLFTAYHQDYYPAGNETMGPQASLAGRQLGMDFEPRDGWRMYHGQSVPGFPVHPHRGFETITFVRKGFVDHSDSLGAAARFGNGDIQWLTAGAGIQHSEMFPLVNQEGENTTELFQIWLNLPARSKMAKPHFQMTWNSSVPKVTVADAQGRNTLVTTITGAPLFPQSAAAISAPTPPPESWAADPDNHVRLVTLRLDPHATVTLPPAPAGVNRALYFYLGAQLQVDGDSVPVGVGMRIDGSQSVTLTNGAEAGEVMLMEGRPINEPVAQHGPFVMNYPGEIRQAMIDYQSTRFGGWPWPSDAPVHPRKRGRFANYGDGKIEKPT